MKWVEQLPQQKTATLEATPIRTIEELATTASSLDQLIVEVCGSVFVAGVTDRNPRPAVSVAVTLYTMAVAPPARRGTGSRLP